ncbi:MAG: sodium:proline symporter [Alphaproteobacteria bacterium BRH_c36]|nr:MAG: sodium:proline symporter [Alphaproteobacteria bacterium BRH_c36]
MDNPVVTLALITAAVALISVRYSPNAQTPESFYKGHDASGNAPSVLALTFSQVTTWIFARSIMNAAILGYFYGIAGALAYSAYYLSFLTGAAIISSLRFRHGFSSVQEFLSHRFGLAGTTSYNFVVGVRLLSEVFANLLVIGLIFGMDGSQEYVASIILVGAATLAYSLLGGLNASIRTDAIQMSLFLIVLGALMAVAIASGSFDVPAMTSTSPDAANPGWVLLIVALLQVWSYPLHDPVMMDRGFIADRKTTMASFYHAAWISVLCIMAFGLLGVWAGVNKLDGESFLPTLTRLIGHWPMLLFNIALVVSCMSTLDSTFASTAKLAVVDMRLGKPTVANGRVAMAVFMLGGLLMVFFGSKDLFGAVAVSGTASMFLAPVVFFSLWMGRTDVPVWSYLAAFFSAMAAAIFYFTESSGYTNLIAPLTGLEHKYSKLLVLSALTLAIGCGAFALGIVTGGARPRIAAGGA